MSDETSTTIRERVAKAINDRVADHNWLMGWDAALAAADAAIAIVVEVYRNGQASLIEEERRDE